MLIGEIAAAAIVALIVVVAWRQEGSERDASPPPTPASDADVERLVASGRTIDAIKLHRTLHGTDLKTAKDAVDRIRARQAGGPVVRRVAVIAVAVLVLSGTARALVICTMPDGKTYAGDRRQPGAR